MELDHVCIAVRSIDSAIVKLTCLLGYKRRTARVTNSRQKVNVVFLSKPGSIDIKLIEPSSEDSPLWASLRKGEGLHHLCFRTDDTATALEDLAAAGCESCRPRLQGRHSTITSSRLATRAAASTLN